MARLVLNIQHPHIHPAASTTHTLLNCRLLLLVLLETWPSVLKLMENRMVLSSQPSVRQSLPFRFLAPKSGVVVNKATHHVLTHVEATLGTYTRANEAAIWLMVSEASVALPPGGRDVATIGALRNLWRNDDTLPERPCSRTAGSSHTHNRELAQVVR